MSSTSLEIKLPLGSRTRPVAFDMVLHFRGAILELQHQRPTQNLHANSLSIAVLTRGASLPTVVDSTRFQDSQCEWF